MNDAEHQKQRYLCEKLTNQFYLVYRRVTEIMEKNCKMVKKN